MIKICLGTAQFGFDYGITNNIGKVSKKEVEKIMNFAKTNNINFFDTAQGYGESEKVLGKFLYKFSNPKVSTKLSSNNNTTFTEKDIKYWESSFQRSLDNLKINIIDTFLIHDSNDLKKEGNKFLKSWLNSLLERNLVRRIGISIYEACDLKEISLENIKLVQLPLSLYDQRMITNGTIDKLKEKKISIHARSIFFQGLLLSDEKYWPKFISNNLRNHHKKNFQPFKKELVLNTLLNFINNCDFLESALIGITCLNELKEILKICQNLEVLDIKKFRKFSWDNDYELDPRNWK